MSNNSTSSKLKINKISVSDVNLFNNLTIIEKALNIIDVKTKLLTPLN